MNGVTGRMGTNQHLVRSILAIRSQGGLDIGAGELLWPEPVLVGRDERKLDALAEPHELEYTTDLDGAHAALKAAGANVDDEISRYGDPVPPMFWLRDPDGNSLIVVQPTS